VREPTGLATRPPAAVLLLGVLLAHAACRAPQDAFTERIAARLREHQPDTTVAVKTRLHLELVAKDGTSQQMFLDNLWRHCQADPQGCEESIARSVRQAGSGLGATEAFLKAEFVRPLLKDREWMENVRRTVEEGPPDQAAGNAVVSRPFVADLFVVYAFDLPDGMRMMRRVDLAALKLDDQGVHALALANLERAVPELKPEAVQPGSRIRVLHAGDSYEASRLILHDRWKDLAQQVKGDLVAAAPSRDYVYLTGSREDLPGLRALARRAAEENHHPLSPTLLRWRTGGWEVLP
jgi:hypothetical protein